MMKKECKRKEKIEKEKKSIEIKNIKIIKEKENIKKIISNKS